MVYAREMNKHVPTHLYDKTDQKWILKDHDPNRRVITYSPEDSKHGMIIYPEQIEKDFLKKDRPEPKSKMVQQGKYECAPAALAMLLDVPLFTVKKMMGKHHWRNDSTGADDFITMQVARDLGFDLFPLCFGQIKENAPRGLVGMPSLNIPGAYHAITWTGEEILDPNWGKEGRFYWGCEWSPITMRANFLKVVLKGNLSEEDRKILDNSYKLRRKAGLMRSIHEDLIRKNRDLFGDYDPLAKEEITSSKPQT